MSCVIHSNFIDLEGLVNLTVGFHIVSNVKTTVSVDELI